VRSLERDRLLVERMGSIAYQLLNLLAGGGVINATEEFFEGGAVLSRGDEGGFFVAGGVDLEEVFGRAGGVVDVLAELKGEDGIFGAMDDQNGGGDFFESGEGVEL
jgi:hypothetical protein